MKVSDIDIARVCHETCRALQNVLDEPCPSDPWDALTADDRESVLYGVARARGGNSAEQMHQLWVDFKLAHGWKHGLVKDTVKRTHPNLVSYDQLPKGEQLKDKLFLCIVDLMGELNA